VAGPGAAFAGVGSIAAGLVQAFTGEPTTASLVLTIIGPSVISLWLLVMGVLVGRRAPRERSAQGKTAAVRTDQAGPLARVPQGADTAWRVDESPSFAGSRVQSSNNVCGPPPTSSSRIADGWSRRVP
jgi:hypothetical protein